MVWIGLGFEILVLAEVKWETTNPNHTKIQTKREAEYSRAAALCRRPLLADSARCYDNYDN